jgi:hypothetical protein
VNHGQDAHGTNRRGRAIRGQPASAVADGKATGEEELCAIAKDLPMSTEQALHPEKFFDPLLLDPPISISDPTVERSFALAGGWYVAFRDTFGEMVCALLAGAKDSTSARGGGPSAADLTDPAHYLDEAAAGWGGDRFYLIVKRREARPFVPIGPAEDPYEYRGVCVTVWDTPKDREEFVAALLGESPVATYEKNTPSPPEGRAVERLGQRAAVFFFGFAGPEWNSIAARLRESPPTLTCPSLPP